MSLAKPQDLNEHPELAILEVLDVTLQQSIYALFAAHPELVSGESLECITAPGPETWLADAIYNHGCALQHAIRRYHEALARRRCARDSCDEDF